MRSLAIFSTIRSCWLLNKLQYYSALAKYSSVSHISRSLSEDESFKKRKNDLLKQINRLMVLCTAELIDNEKRQNRRGYLVCNMEDEPEYKAKEKLFKLRNKIEFDKPIVKSDYEETWIEPTAFGVPLSAFKYIFVAAAVITGSILLR